MPHMTEAIKKYREVDAISYSKFSKLATHPRNLLADEKKKSDSLDFGSLVDCLMFTPEDFDNSFYKTSVKKPGGEMQKWLDAYLAYELPTDFTLMDTDEIIMKSRAVSGYNKKLLPATALQKFHDECDEYLTVIGEAGDRVIVFSEDMDRAIADQSKLLSNEFTAPYFTKSKELEIRNQLDIYFEYDGLKFKCLLDGAIFDHKNKTIKPYDLKTTSESTLAFEGEFIKWKYHIQAGLYRLGLSIAYPDYKILPFEFIVVNDWEEPIIWGVDDALHSICLLGGMLRSGRKIKGIYQLIEEYKWHEKEGKYDYPSSFYISGGIKWIDIT